MCYYSSAEVSVSIKEVSLLINCGAAGRVYDKITWFNQLT